MTRSERKASSFSATRLPLGLERLEDRAVPAYTATLAGTVATFTGDASGDTLTFTIDGGNLRHNRFSAGNPGFISDLDFDSAVAGVQTLAADAAAVVNVNAGDGDDTVTLGDGVQLNGTLDGGGGTDTIDYSAYTTPVAVNLGANAPGLTATLGADQEVPPTDSTATGSATLTYNNTAHTFDITVTVDGIAPADVTGFHIHRGPFGVSAPIIVDFVPGGVPIAPLTPTATGFTFTATGVALDPLHEAALLGGVTYV
ncbi:MAG TPA: CHRD domain-containing protein, partial [Fimbriiglobus sp.]|nr:CHRD domain-containing protein [Fimbriiglobus sp.]